MTERIIRTFCFHSWTKWGEPRTMTWINYDNDRVHGVQSQRRDCKKCGKVKYRKCT